MEATRTPVGFWTSLIPRSCRRPALCRSQVHDTPAEGELAAAAAAAAAATVDPALALAAAAAAAAAASAAGVSNSGAAGSLPFRHAHHWAALDWEW